MNGQSLAHDRPLDDRQIDLWYVFSDKITEPDLFDEYRALLPRDQLEQERRFVFEKSRLQFLVTRALVRTVLSHYTGDAPCRWKFGRNAYGKPAVTGYPLGAAAGAMKFNLSHTSGLVTCAVTLGPEVGVDAEGLPGRGDHLQLARRYFAAAEVAVLERLPTEQQRTAFLRFWTLKEAFIKARGMGLSIPLDEFAFSLAKGRPPIVCFTRGGQEDPNQWQFAQLRLDSRYQIALAVNLPRRKRIVIQVRQTVPLRWQSDGRVLPFSPSNEWHL